MLSTQGWAGQTYAFRSILSHLTTQDTRADMLAWYVIASMLGSALGSEASGRVFQTLVSSGLVRDKCIPFGFLVLHYRRVDQHLSDSHDDGGLREDCSERSTDC